MFEFETVIGSQLEEYIPQLADLRIEIFREYPYLYEGTIEYESRYLKTYNSCEGALAVIAKSKGKVIGASTGLPLADETAEFKKPFLDLGIDPKTVFYCGESVLKNEFRGQGIYKKFFSEREEYARTIEGIEKICFCGVVRPQNHPLRPEGYCALDSIWQYFGYRPLDGAVAYFSWKDIDQKEETKHPMQFWIKEFF